MMNERFNRKVIESGKQHIQDYKDFLPTLDVIIDMAEKYIDLTTETKPYVSGDRFQCPSCFRYIKDYDIGKMGYHCKYCGQALDANWMREYLTANGYTDNDSEDIE